MLRSCLLWAPALLVLAACGGGSETEALPDAGPLEPDAGFLPHVDAGLPGADAGVADARPADGGAALEDTGAPLPDAGERDAGERDAGERDAGATDTGAPDAGSPAPDAGLADAGGSAADAGDAPDSGTWGACEANGEAGTCLEVSRCGGVTTPGLCPGPTSVQCCTGALCEPDPPNPNANLGEGAGVGGCLGGMVPVTSFCIDRYEASLLELLPGGAEQAWSPYRHPGTRSVRAVSVAGAVPQGYIDADTAAAACAASGKRLCTDAEWLEACRGPSGTTYPYGDERLDGVCNDDRDVHPAVELFGDQPNPFAHLDSPCINQLADGLDRAGGNTGCESAYGPFDMMGNLHEWTADPAGTFRGGFYVDTAINGQGCLYVTTAHDRGYWDYSTGFRCCADLP